MAPVFVSRASVSLIMMIMFVIHIVQTIKSISGDPAPAELYGIPAMRSYPEAIRGLAKDC